MPPPAPVASVPFLRVRPETETVALLATLKTRLALFPLTASASAPGPERVRSLSSAISPLVSVMVPVTVKLMVSPAVALATA
jgi:hypothetical protein